MKIFIAADHAGFALKNALAEHIRTLGYEVEDMGAFAQNPEDDYPDFMTPLARAVAFDATARGIVIGKSGEGEAMCVNRIKNVRAAVFYGGSEEIVQLAREHNDANILSLGAGFITTEEAKAAVKRFLETQFSDSPRHARRLAKF
ncbi:RpiB/LacA/LacB family sugar-phosphate isomerase [bacterium]|nr:MAG: RpiB/LacA/LacB family sugar-phosphate isomerase [bacterium]